MSTIRTKVNDDQITVIANAYPFGVAFHADGCIHSVYPDGDDLVALPQGSNCHDHLSTLERTYCSAGTIAPILDILTYSCL